jgi:AcrR family transcriptional regulator
MIAAAGSDGLARASVARVVECAGVSRATFYEHFSNQDECLLAAYQFLAAKVEKALTDLEAVEPEHRLRRALSIALETAQRSPAAMRFMTIEAIGAGPRLRDARERLLARMEAAVRSHLEDLRREN